MLPDGAQRCYGAARHAAACTARQSVVFVMLRERADSCLLRDAADERSPIER